MSCKKCGASMIGTTCPPCTVRSLERLERELGDELGGGIVGPDGRPFDNYGGHPLAGGTFSNRLDDGPSWESATKWFMGNREPRGTVIDVDAQEVDPDPDAKALSRTR